MSDAENHALTEEELGEPDPTNIPDDEAFSAFYDRWCDAVYGLAFHILCDQTRAEEVTEEVFCRAWRFMRHLDEEVQTSRLWLLRLTQSLAVTTLRSASKQHAGSPISAPGAATASTDPHRTVANVRQVRSSAVELAFWDGLTCSEIAAATGVTVAQALDDLSAGLRGFDGRMARSARCLDGDRSSPTCG